VIPIRMDLVEAAVEQRETGVTVMEQICRLLGITLDEIVLVWSSPPCESYTTLGYTNEPAGHHFRDHSSKERGSRPMESCHGPSDHAKRILAGNHDLLTEGITLSALKYGQG